MARRTGSGFTSPFLPTPAQIASIHRVTRFGTLPPNPSSLQATVSLAKTELRRYDSEIAKLQSELDRLVSERDTLFSYAASCRSVLSARQRLPTEVLVCIFQLCFPHDAYQLGYQTSSKTEVRRISQYHLLKLAEVSFRWHQIAMGTPQLWSFITVNTSIWDMSRQRRQPQTLLKGLESSLLRSQNHPLHLQVDLTWQNYGDLVFQLFIKYAHKWKDVRIRSDAAPSTRSATTLGRLERLETLELELGRKALNLGSLEAPRLRHFIFRGKFNSLPASFPWNQLQTCTYNNHTDPDTPIFSPLSVLRTANDAAAFTFRLTIYEQSVHETMISSNVRHLAFEITDPQRSVGNLFDALTLPRLQILEYRPPGWGRSPMWPSASFMALAHRSAFATHLLRLSIHSTITEEELLGCLAVLHCLEELSVFDTFVSERSHSNHTVVKDQLLQGLLCVPGEASLVPNLRMLDVATVMDFTDSVYVDVVVSRIEKICDVDRSGVFDACIQRYPEQRKLSNKAWQKLKSLVDSGTLLFNIMEVELE
ncbi:hypothetical protein R3P38DRAFT_2545603 [Favolaschia claudopus]|uniref:F-box domain-containing protein n=1 Tax=Favolaschia claudopus TaxID=2862362 RepID=A0AAW0AKQ2_9AGAR